MHPALLPRRRWVLPAQRGGVHGRLPEGRQFVVQQGQGDRSARVDQRAGVVSDQRVLDRQTALLQLSEAGDVLGIK